VLPVSVRDQAHGHQGVIYLSGFDDMTDHLLAIAKPSDVIITQVRAACGRLERNFLKRVGKKNTNPKIKLAKLRIVFA